MYKTNIYNAFKNVFENPTNNNIIFTYYIRMRIPAAAYSIGKQAEFEWKSEKLPKNALLYARVCVMWC